MSGLVISPLARAFPRSCGPPSGRLSLSYVSRWCPRLPSPRCRRCCTYWCRTPARPATIKATDSASTSIRAWRSRYELTWSRPIWMCAVSWIRVSAACSIARFSAKMSWRDSGSVYPFAMVSGGRSTRSTQGALAGGAMMPWSLAPSRRRVGSSGGGPAPSIGSVYVMSNIDRAGKYRTTRSSLAVTSSAPSSQFGFFSR